MKTLIFLAAMLVSLGIGFVYFRDLGDISQMVLRVKRDNMIRFIRNEYRLLALGLGAGLLMAYMHLAWDAGAGWLFWPALLLVLFFYGFTWVWVHLGLRQQQATARYFSVEQAADHIAPGASVNVIEHNGVARAHPDSQLMRPHLAGNDAGLAGENVIMTYCAMANLGLGYIPEIEGQACALDVLAQHGNNLIMRDNNTNEPIQQIYGFPERAGQGGPAMRAWPTFRMTFRTFAKAYPQGEVFINLPSGNPFLRLFDLFTETVFSSGIAAQHNDAKPVMDNMTRRDDRLPAKTYVWGINIGDDAAAFTQDFVVENDNLINVEIGGRAIVLAWDPVYESLGAWYNDSGQPVTGIDFFGDSDRGPLQRVEALKSGMFWHVWAEFFPHTDVNRAAVNT